MQKTFKTFKIIGCRFLPKKSIMNGTNPANIFIMTKSKKKNLALLSLKTWMRQKRFYLPIIPNIILGLAQYRRTKRAETIFGVMPFPNITK